MVNYAKDLGNRPAQGGPKAQASTAQTPGIAGLGKLLTGTLNRAKEVQAQYPRGSAGMNMASMFGQAALGQGGGAGSDPPLHMSRPRPVLLDW